MPSRSGLYNDYVDIASRRGFSQVKSTVTERAKNASNILAQPLHHIWTDDRGSVVDVTRSFCLFTGYEKQEMVGRTCNFLQGKGTDPLDILTLRDAVRNGKRTSVVILNYRKDGQPFWNVLTITPESISGRNGYSSEIIGLPIPPSMRPNPALCLEDALALISVFSSVPRSIKSLENENENESVASSRPSTPGSLDSYTFKNVNYASFGLGEEETDPVFSEGYYFIAETCLPTDKGNFRVRAYRDPVTGAEPLALIVGNIEGSEDVVCRVHDQCVTSEVLGSLRCDCKQQLDLAMNHIQEKGAGMVLYLPQEGRGIGLANKIAAYAVQEQGLDTVDANRHLGLPDDARQYNSVKDILNDMNISSLKLLTNNPRKIRCLEELGIKVSDRIPCKVVPTSHYSAQYITTKMARMQHM